MDMHLTGTRQHYNYATGKWTGEPAWATDDEAREYVPQDKGAQNAYTALRARGYSEQAAVLAVLAALGVA